MKSPTREQLKKIQKQADRITQFKEAIKTIKSGGTEHKLAKEKFLYDLIQNQDIAFRALMRKVKIGDTAAINIFYDRLYGKAKETVDFNTNVQFSLKGLALEREKLKETLRQKADDYVLNVDNTMVLPAPPENNG